MADNTSAPASNKGFTQRALDWMEWAGNKLPDPARCCSSSRWLLTWLLASAFLAPVQFSEIDPRSGEPDRQVHPEPAHGPAITTFLTSMVRTFVTGSHLSASCSWRCWAWALPSTAASSTPG